MKFTSRLKTNCNTEHTTFGIMPDELNRINKQANVIWIGKDFLSLGLIKMG